MNMLYRRIKWAIEDKFENLLERCQRFRRGFAWMDVWNMDTWFIHTVEPMLRHLAEHGNGYDDEEFRTPEEWKGMLLYMADLLHDMDGKNLVEEKYGGYDRLTTENVTEMYRIRDENRRKFFELFSEYFYSLWD